MNFLIDPSATSIDDALGVAHVYVLPEHIVRQKQEKGYFQQGAQRYWFKHDCEINDDPRDR